MTTIDKLDFRVSIDYAKRTQLIEQVNQQYHLQDAEFARSVQVPDFSARPAEIDLLLGVIPVERPWAHYSKPPETRYQRRSPFGFFRVAPSLGSFDKEEEDKKKLDWTVCENEEEEDEKKILKRCFEQIDKINDWLSYIVGKMGQFLQG